jgi:hypothetical protein
MRAPAQGVKVRMYRQGLGDCFLLAFPTADPNQSYYVLIDCGLVKGTPEGSLRLKEVADDIRASTDGHVNLLVVTHRHYDHLAGFTLAKDSFAQIKFDNLWLPWLENKDDSDARAVWSATTQALAALNDVVKRPGLDVDHIKALLGFLDEGLGLTGDDPFAAVRALVPTAPVWRKPGEGPLDLPSADASAGVKIAKTYVLGPPRDRTLLSKMDPSSVSSKRETYLTQGGLDTHLAFTLGVDSSAANSPDQRLLADLSYPFDKHLRIATKAASEMPFFQEHYGFPGKPAPQTAPEGSGSSSATTTATNAPGPDAGSAPLATGDEQNETPAGTGLSASKPGTLPTTGMAASRPGTLPTTGMAASGPGSLPTTGMSASAGGDLPTTGMGAKEGDGQGAATSDALGASYDSLAWRRIDSDWTTGAEELALAIDDVVNNTSLVLAFELVGSKKVLLFAADAQVGNWLSWQPLRWQRPDGSGVTTIDLLQNTVLYKVGHHGSHNATVKQTTDGKPWGLALMTREDVVAMIPCDTVIAWQQSGHWQMPDAKLLPHIQDVTRGRYLRIDEGVPEQPSGAQPADPASWEAFRQRITPPPASIKPYPPGVPDDQNPDKIVRKAVRPDPLYIEFDVLE